MSEQPTPETDAVSEDIGEVMGCMMVDKEFAQKLERERDELRRWTSVNGVIELQRERDEAREALRALAPLTYHDCFFYKDIMGNCILCKKEETK